MAGSACCILPRIGEWARIDQLVLMRIEELQQAAREFRTHLDRIKQESPDVDWFFGDILGNIDAIGGLLTGGNRDLFGRLSGGRIADIGAADGDLSFFLETKGFRPEIVDFAAYNFNQLEAAYRLKEALDSSVPIHEIDINGQFELPHRYDAVIFLGILYHLQNPYLALETLAHTSRYCILSTRVAAWMHSGPWPWQFRGRIRNRPIAYLLEPDEFNNDSTNYWIFSEAGLKRIVERTGWRILDFKTYGKRWTSNPRDPKRDQRAFMPLESRHT
ncbi:class I SAM-dependent methyltransferase [Halomonas denitrificans]|nr:class I SAM-dependent methyltransferase [Halomonas denitrificans]